MASFVFDKVKRQPIKFRNPIHLYVKQWNVISLLPYNIPDLMFLDELLSNSLVPSEYPPIKNDTFDFEKKEIINPLNGMKEVHLFPLKRKEKSERDTFMHLLSCLSMPKRHHLLPFAAIKDISPLKRSSNKKDWDFDIFVSRYVESGGSITDLLPNTDDIINHNSYLGHQYLMK